MLAFDVNDDSRLSWLLLLVIEWIKVVQREDDNNNDSSV